MAETDLPILIAGGGIAGLSLARALRLRGIEAQVFEKRAETSRDGLAINLPGNAINALALLGLKDEIAALGQPILRREYRTDGDRLLFAVDEAAFWGSENQSRAVRRGDLLALLSRDLPADRLQRGAEVVGVAQDDGGVRVSLGDGADAAGRALVGADGVRSNVRRLIMTDAFRREALLAKSSWRFMAPNPGVDCCKARSRWE